MQMLLTGDLIDAATAERFGLINQHVPHDQLETHTFELAKKIASKSALTLAIGKEAFYKQSELNLKDAYEYTRKVMVDNLQTHDAQEGINAFIDKRIPVWCAK